MRNYSEIAKQILNEKLMYHSKALSQDAISINLFNIIDTFDILSFDFELVTFDSIFSSLIASLLFGIDPSEISVFNLCYDVQLPSSEEYERGILLKISNVSCVDKYPGLFKDLFPTYENLKPFIAQKCYYGRGAYGMCYADPVVVREFLRSTSIKEVKVKSEDVSRSIYSSFAEVAEMRRDLVELYWELQNYISDAKKYDPYWDYAWWDFSLWAEETFELEKFDKSKAPIDPEHVADALAGSFWDVAVWDFSLWAEETHSTPEGLELLKNVAELFDKAMDIANVIVYEERSRLSMTPILVANYSRAEERLEPEKSRRMQDYGELRALYYSLTKDVRDVLSIYPTPIQIRYSAAVSNLMARFSKTRGWGLDAYKAMSIDELREEWVREWVGKGLDENILRDIFEKIRLRLEVYRDIRVSKELKRLVMKMKR